VVHEAAGDRFGNLEINAFSTFVVTAKRRAATEDLISRRGWTGIDVEEVWQMPTIFIGSLDQIRADLRARRASDSACRTSSSARTGCPHSPRSSAVGKTPH